MSMRKTLITNAAALVAVAGLSGGVFAQQGSSGNRSPGQQGQSGQSGQQNPQNQQNQQNATGSQNSPSQQAPEGFVLIQDKVVYLMANEPQNHFVRALDDFSLNDKQKAAGELEVAASYIDDIASRANQQDKQTVSQCADTLRQLAKQVRNGSITDPKQLTNDFAKANIALADHFQKSADDALSNHKQVKAGYDLQEATMSFRQALVWSNQSADKQSAQVIQDAQQVASHLLQPTMQQGGQGGQGSSANASNNQGAGQNNQGAGIASNQGSLKDPQQVSQDLAKQIDQLQQQIAKGGQEQGQGQGGNTARE